VDLGHCLLKIRDGFHATVIEAQEFIKAMEKLIGPCDPMALSKFSSSISSKDKEKVDDILKRQKVKKNKKGIYVPGYIYETEEDFSLIVRYLAPTEFRHIVAETTMVYLISINEAFVSEFLKLIYRHRSNMLKSNKKQLSYEEVCCQDSLEDLIAYMAEKKAAATVDDGIDKMDTYLNEQFNIELNKYKGWQDLRESVYRRNIIIHNRGIANKTYCKKIDSSKELGKKVETDYKYAIDLAENISGFIDYMHNKIAKKLKLRLDY